MTTQTQSLAAWLPRFAAKVEVAKSGCWLWTARLNRNGYGMFMDPDSKRSRVAHRYAYEVARGPIPEGLQLDHLCRVRHCVNPDHLEAVTQRENLLRGETLTAKAAAATHCPANHPYAGDNLYINPKGERLCRACHRARVAAARAKNPEKMRAQARAADARYRARKRALAAPYAGAEGWQEGWAL